MKKKKSSIPLHQSRLHHQNCCPHPQACHYLAIKKKKKKKKINRGWKGMDESEEKVLNLAGLAELDSLFRFELSTSRVIESLTNRAKSRLGARVKLLFARGAR
jgi:hypothetical protein